MGRRAGAEATQSAPLSVAGAAWGSDRMTSPATSAVRESLIDEILRRKRPALTNRIVLIADSDSQIFGARHHIDALQARGRRCELMIFSANRVPQALLAQVRAQYEAIEIDAGLDAGLPRLLDHLDEDDAIGLFASGSLIQLCIEKIRGHASAMGRKRPFIFTGFNGFVYEKFEEGVAWRLGADLLCLNSQRDLENFLAVYGRTAFGDQPIAITGIPFTPSAKRAPAPGRKRFVFAEQNIVPKSAKERWLLGVLLQEVAMANPEWDVIVKPRVKPGEESFHKYSIHIQSVLEQTPIRADNLRISYQSLLDLLPQSSGFGTISSTALFAALDAGVPSVIFGDFGVRNNYGTHMFVNSGLMREASATPQFEALLDNTLDPEWRRIVTGGADYDSVLAHLDRFDPECAPPPLCSSTQSLTKWVAERRASSQPGDANSALDSGSLEEVEAVIWAMLAAPDAERGPLLRALWRRQLLAGKWERSRKTLRELYESRAIPKWRFTALTVMARYPTKHLLWALARAGAL